MNHERHAELFNCSDLSITLIGAGGIGALTAVMIGKMGVPLLTIIDNDAVDPINLATQFHRISDVGRLKVDAVGTMVNEFSDDTSVSTIFSKVDRFFPLRDQIIISAVDSISSRQEIWAAVQDNCMWYLDARMGAEIFQLHCIDMRAGNSATWYNNLLAQQSDETMPEAPCTMKATQYTSLFASGHILNALKRISLGQTPPRYLSHNIPTDYIFTH